MIKQPAYRWPHWIWNCAKDVMKVSTRTRYGLRLLVYIASQEPETLVNVREVSKEESLSAKYLEHIVRALKKAGILSVVRGAHGGYSMARDPKTITVREVFEALEGSSFFIDCLKDTDACERREECSTYGFWAEFQETVNGFLEGVTVGDLVEQQREKSMGLMFYI